MVDQDFPQPVEPQPGGPEVTSNDKTLAAIAYFVPFIGSAIILLSESNKVRPFQKFHGTQALGLAVAYVVWYIVWGILSTILNAVTGGLACCITWIPYLLAAVPAIYYAYQSYQGLVFDVPFLTDFMVQQGWLQRI